MFTKEFRKREIRHIQYVRVYVTFNLNLQHGEHRERSRRIYVHVYSWPLVKY